MVLIMNSKKVFLLLFSLVIISLFSNVVFASNHDGDGGLGEGLGGVAETIHELFGFIPEVLTLEKLTGAESGSSALFWAKFLIWLLLFSVIYC